MVEIVTCRNARARATKSIAADVVLGDMVKRYGLALDLGMSFENHSNEMTELVLWIDSDKNTLPYSRLGLDDGDAVKL